MGAGHGRFREDMFDTWAKANETYPGGTRDLMGYVGDTMGEAECYE